MKRLAIALAAIGVSMSALAALPAATDPTVVTVPQLPGGFFIGGTAYYLQPSSTHGDLDYATTTATSVLSTDVLTTINSLKPDYSWGWGANLGYIFPGTGNDIEASYFYLRNKESAYVDAAGTPGAATLNPDGTFTFPSPFIAPIVGVNPVIEAAQLANNLGVTNLVTRGNFINSEVKSTFNRFDLTVGQYIDVGCRLVLHPKAGLTWASIDRDLSTKSAGSVIGGTENPSVPVLKVSVVQETNEESKFNGIGPIFGLDSSYYLGYGFGFVSHVDTALLVGNIKSSIDDTATVYLINNNTGEWVDSYPLNGFPTTADSNRTRRVVPVLDGKLGLDYTFVFNNTANSDITLEAGWQFSNYFNAIDRQATIPHSTSDIGLNGPYVSLVLHV